jgi:UDP-N-acetylmuramoyl-L-alanyl-D-glutamate--2,6-diaminopimelate ligase
MDNYVAAKLALLTLPEVRFAVVNFSGNFLEQILATIPENVRIWGVSFDGKKRGGVNVLDISAVTCFEGGLCFDVEYQSDRQGVTVPLYGEVNVENVAMVMAALLALGYSLREACVRVQKIQPIAGRMELFKSKKALPAVVVDYAHTPDALEKLLVMVRQHCEGVIWLVFGCGGDRDVGKRSQMGVIAEQFSDHVIVTNDNPRSESEQKIVSDIVSLCDDSKIEVIYDRRRAIRTAIEKAKKGDCVVVAGKGHEEYQELKGERIELSDRKIIAALVASEERSC